MKQNLWKKKKKQQHVAEWQRNGFTLGDVCGVLAVGWIAEHGQLIQLKFKRGTPDKRDLQAILCCVDATL